MTPTTVTPTTVTPTPIDLIFDPNVLTLVFTELISIAYTEKGCEFAYQCIQNCYDVCPKWGKVISKQLSYHCRFPKEIRESKMVKTTVYNGRYKLKNIWPGHKRVEITLKMSIEFDFKMSAGQPKVCPTLEFTFKPTCYTDLNQKKWKFCPWCCILHFDRSKKHHSKRCIIRPV